MKTKPKAPGLRALLATPEGWPDETHHTAAEKIIIYGIQKKIALYTVKLVETAERGGKLPSQREFLARVINSESARIFGAKKCPKK